MRVVHMGLWRVRDNPDPAVLARAQEKVASFTEAVPGIIRAREMGLHVVVSDGSAEAPGLALADNGAPPQPAIQRPTFILLHIPRASSRSHTPGADRTIPCPAT